MKTQNFDAILKYFQAIDEANAKIGKYSRTSQAGVFVPSRLIDLSIGIEILINEGLIEQKLIFCDAGCGDGRVVALASGIYSIPSIGLEGDSQLFEIAKANIDYLKKLGILNGNLASIVQGDFNEDSTYRKEGLRFDDIATFFNFVDNHRNLIQKIRQQSSKGTRLVIECPWEKPQVLDGFSLRRAVRISNISPIGQNLYLYEKV